MHIYVDVMYNTYMCACTRKPKILKCTWSESRTTSYQLVMHENTHIYTRRHVPVRASAHLFNPIPIALHNLANDLLRDSHRDYPRL